MSDTCYTCNAALSYGSKFCQECGAKRVTQRLSIIGLFQTIWKSITNFDLPLLSTIKWLGLKPEKVTIGFIEGKRRVITSPIKFTIIILTFYGLYQYLFPQFIETLYQNNSMNSFKEGWNSFSTQEDSSIDPIIKWVHKHYQLIVIMWGPVIGIINYKLYKSNKLNLAEHISIALYAISFSSFLVILIGIFFNVLNQQDKLFLYKNSSSIIQIISIVWVIQRTLKGAYYKHIIYFLGAMIFFQFLLFLLIINFNLISF